jgi:hypothetical protein
MTTSKKLPDERIYKEIKEGTRSHNDIIVPHESHGTSMLLWMLVDGVGLSLIAACTILEGFELWKDFFNEYLEYNYPAMSFWFSGRICQTMGLVILLLHAASMQGFHELEWAGMAMLTVGPVLNMCACSIFDTGGDASFIFNKQWMTSESLELLGIFILDLSLVEGPDLIVLLEEVIGFAILACAAIIDFEYSAGSFLPSTTMRVDLIHISDCLGLFLLTVVAVGQYHIRVAKHETGQQQLLPHHSLTGQQLLQHVQHHSVSTHVGGSSINSIQKIPSVNNLYMRHPQISAYTSVDSYDIEEERESRDEENRSTMNHRDHSHRMNGLTTQPYQVIQLAMSINTSKPPLNGQHQQHND